MRLSDLAVRALGRGRAPERSAPPDIFGAADPEAIRDDPLVACLAYIAREFSLPFSRNMAVAGLPLRAGRLTVDLVPRAAERLGLVARLVRRDIARVPALVAPFIVLFDNGDAAVVTELRGEGQRARIVFPTVSASPRTVSMRQLAHDASGYLLYVTTAAVAPGASGARAARPAGHWLWSVIWRFWPSWIQVVLAAFVINLLGLATPLFVMNVYDRVIPNIAIPTLWALSAGVAIALLFDFLLRQLRAVVLDSTGRRVDMAVGTSIFEQVLALSSAARTGAAGHLANQVREFESVRDFFTSASIIAITDLLFIGIFIAMMALIVGPLAWVPAMAVPLVIGATLLVQRPLGRALARAQSHSARRHSLLVESLVSAETIKTVGGESVVQRRFEDATAANARAHSGARMWSSLIINLTTWVQQVVSVLIIVWGVFLVGDGTITIGALIAANILSGRVLGPLAGIAQTLTRAEQAFTAVRALNGFMALARDGAEASPAGRRIEIGSVAFRNVAFAYPGSDQPVLQDVSLTIRAGERVGMIGRIGSGKTTLGRLMSGLYLADEGSVQIDGVDVRQYDPADLREGVGFVGQDCELLAGTLRDNITLGRPDATQQEIDEAVHLAGLDRFVGEDPRGLMMPIGERGRGLSGGQRQAVALARAFIRKPRILFLDEPSSAMDTGFERALIERLSRYDEEVTMIVSTHRAAFLDLADRLVVLDAGRVVADGPKEAVLKSLKAGQYRA